ncbi:MAG: hypothetical protein CVV02_14625 [Firmicutes bacterium HGW-Firmicutes-7]|nr:MAG: hypothetical protein CVV02_14625 [Firmicutes bacterium HGW-Firmicutes-7]
MMNFFEFGDMSLKSIIRYLYLMGCITLLYKAFLVGRVLYLTNTYAKETSYMQGGQQWYSSIEVNNMPLGLFGGLAFFIVSLLIWKIICELLYIIFERIGRQ